MHRQEGRSCVHVPGTCENHECDAVVPDGTAWCSTHHDEFLARLHGRASSRADQIRAIQLEIGAWLRRHQPDRR